MSGRDEFDGVYESDEEDIKCIIHMPNSSSSSSEDLETDVKDASTALPVHVPDSTNFKDADHIYPASIKAQLEQTYPALMQQLHALVETVVVTVYLSVSFLLHWKLPGTVPRNVICDVCIFSPSRPVTLLTFKHKSKKDKTLEYNAKLARHLITSVRKHLFPTFTVVNGVIDIEDCATDTLYQFQVDKLESEARITSVPSWLHINDSQYRRLLDFFIKIVPVSNSDEDIKKHNTVNVEASPKVDSYLLSNDSNKTNLWCHRNGSEKPKQDQAEFTKISGKLQRATTVNTARKVKVLAERVCLMDSERCESNVKTRLIPREYKDIGTQTVFNNQVFEERVQECVQFPVNFLNSQISFDMVNFDEGSKKLHMLDLPRRFPQKKKENSAPHDAKHHCLTHNQKHRRTKSDSFELVQIVHSPGDKQVRRTISFSGGPVLWNHIGTTTKA